MTKWHAYVAHMAKHMNMVGGPLWWGALGPDPFPPLNPALEFHSCVFYREISHHELLSKILYLLLAPGIAFLQLASCKYK